MSLPLVSLFVFAFAGQRIVNRLRTSLFSSILRQEVAFFDKTRTGELINRLSGDTALVGRSVTENLSDGLRAGAQASVGISMMVFVSPNLPTFVWSGASSVNHGCNLWTIATETDQSHPGFPGTSHSAS